MTDIKPKFIEIDGGKVTAVSVTDATGTRHLFADESQVIFMVHVVEHDGGRIDLWSGPDYEQAVREAEAARREWGMDEPVHDLIAGGRA